MSRARSVVIVGGGVIGAACAHYLIESGWNVTVVDRGRFAGACSHGNCGLVCPSHVLPLAEPGAVGGALRSMFRRNSPFHIRPRLDPALWAWLLGFARRCNRASMIEAGRGIQALLHSSMELYRGLVEQGGLQCEWQARGLLFAYRDQTALDAYAATDRLLAETFAEPARRLAGDEMSQLEPALRPGLAGGWYYESDAHLRPDRLMASWRTSLQSRGATILENCEFRGFAAGHDADTAVSIVTADGTLAADAFVVATGAWTPLLNRHLGCRIPIQPGKGYSITMPRPQTCPSIPLIFPETRVAVTPMKSAYRIGSMMEFAGYDDSLKPHRLALLKAGAEPYLREPYADPVEETWFGWRPMTCDGLPVIDRSPALTNVVVAAGHNMLGLSMAPATGRLVAELLDGRPPHVDPAPYSAARFGGTRSPAGWSPVGKPRAGR